LPELPDIVVYIQALEQRLLGRKLRRLSISSPFLLRTAVPPISAINGKKIVAFQRIGKRICFGFEDELWLVLHLMIAGRLHWYDASSSAPKKSPLAIFEFDNGSLTLTEAGTRKRASLSLVSGQTGLDDLDPGGVEVLDTDLAEFKAALVTSNHTLKRALTDPRILSGIGNSYSDEILFNAQLSPFVQTQKLTDEQFNTLFAATRSTLIEWRDRLRVSTGDEFPEKVTAFRPEMAVHGRYGQPCPRCGTKIQRIRYASNETNYCPQCQTGGKLLADRALSRLLHSDWPKTLEELENRKAERRVPAPGKRKPIETT
jgi:formamidopyrimidine-DNA glycosylase